MEFLADVNLSTQTLSQLECNVEFFSALEEEGRKEEEALLAPGPQRERVIAEMRRVVDGVFG